MSAFKDFESLFKLSLYVFYVEHASDHINLVILMRPKVISISSYFFLHFVLGIGAEGGERREGG